MYFQRQHILISSILGHFIILYIYNFKYNTHLCTLFFSEHLISHRLPCSHAVWSLVLDGSLLNRVSSGIPANENVQIGRQPYRQKCLNRTIFQEHFYDNHLKSISNLTGVNSVLLLLSRRQCTVL